MTQTELDRLVAEIGEEILARVGGAALPARKGEGLNLPDQVCPGCVQRCAQTCARNTRQIIDAGADRVSSSERLTRIDPSIAALIDHTILKPEATRDDVVKVCREARQYGFASVCVNPSGDREAVRQDIRRVVETAHEAGAIVKVILETALLDDAQKVAGCELAKQAGADFVKTSTGFSTAGATAHDVALMRGVVGPGMGVKAAGGIRTLSDLRAMTAAGATRIGASASIKIVEATAA